MVNVSYYFIYLLIHFASSRFSFFCHTTILYSNIVGISIMLIFYIYIIQHKKHQRKGKSYFVWDTHTHQTLLFYCIMKVLCDYLLSTAKSHLCNTAYFRRHAFSTVPTCLANCKKFKQLYIVTF